MFRARAVFPWPPVVLLIQVFFQKITKTYKYSRNGSPWFKNQQKLKNYGFAQTSGHHELRLEKRCTNHTTNTDLGATATRFVNMCMFLLFFEKILVSKIPRGATGIPPERGTLT